MGNFDEGSRVKFFNKSKSSKCHRNGLEIHNDGKWPEDLKGNT